MVPPTKMVRLTKKGRHCHRRWPGILERDPALCGLGCKTVHMRKYCVFLMRPNDLPSCIRSRSCGGIGWQMGQKALCGVALRGLRRLARLEGAARNYRLYDWVSNISRQGTHTLIACKHCQTPIRTARSRAQTAGDNNRTGCGALLQRRSYWPTVRVLGHPMLVSRPGETVSKHAAFRRLRKFLGVDRCNSNCRHAYAMRCVGAQDGISSRSRRSSSHSADLGRPSGARR